MRQYKIKGTNLNPFVCRNTAIVKCQELGINSSSIITVNIPSFVCDFCGVYVAEYPRCSQCEEELSIIY